MNNGLGEQGVRAPTPLNHQVKVASMEINAVVLIKLTE